MHVINPDPEVVEANYASRDDKRRLLWFIARTCSNREGDSGKLIQASASVAAIRELNAMDGDHAKDGSREPMIISFNQSFGRADPSSRHLPPLSQSLFADARTPDDDDCTEYR